MAPDNTVPTAAPEHLPARDVKPGMWVAFVGEDYEGALSEVLFTHTNPIGTIAIIVSFDGEAAQHNVTPDQWYRLGTDAEVVAAQHAATRRRIAAQLSELADLFANDNMPIPVVGSLSITANMPTAAAARAMADILGVELRDSGRYVRASWPAGSPVYDSGVHLYIDAPATPELPPGDADE